MDRPSLPGDFAFRVVREEDLLNVEFRFLGFELVDGLLRPVPGSSARIAIYFPGQNLAEEIFVARPGGQENGQRKNAEPDDPEENAEPYDPEEFEVPLLDPSEARPPVRAILSGPSWLAFSCDEALDKIPLDPELWLRLLERAHRFPIVLPRATVEPSAAVTSAGEVVPPPPRGDETALELPLRLFIAPSVPTLVRASRPARKERYRELWHVGLRSSVPIAPSKAPQGLEREDVPAELKPPRRVTLQARSFYSPDHRRSGEPPFDQYFPRRQQLSLHALTRHLLVEQILGGNGIIDVEHLELSALGANSQLYYANSKSIAEIELQQMAEGSVGEHVGGAVAPPRTQLYLWKHRIVVGRDVCFAEAFFGWLFPFLYPAVYVELTERRFAALEDNENAPGAYLLKRRFILSLDPKKQFLSSKAAVGREMPLKLALLETVQSPDLEDPASVDVRDLHPPADNPKLDVNELAREARNRGLFFWPKVLTTKVQAKAGEARDVDWSLRTWDESDQEHHTSTAHLFFASHLRTGRALYEAQSSERRTIRFPSQKVAFAPEQPEIRITLPGGKQLQHHLEAIDLAAAEFLGSLLLPIFRDPKKELEKILIEVRAELQSAYTKASDELKEQLEGLRSKADALDAALAETGSNLVALVQRFAEDVERKAGFVAETLAPILLRSIRGHDGSVEELRVKIREALTTASSEVSAEVGQKLERVRSKAAACYDALEESVSSAPDLVRRLAEDIPAQLRAARRLSSTLETTAVTFGSKILSHELAAATVLLAFTEVTAADLQSRDSLEAWVERARMNSKQVFAEPAIKRLKDRLWSILRAAKEDPKTTLDSYLRHSREFLRSLDEARAAAEILGARTLHTVFEKAAVVLPALKSLVPGTPVREIEWIEDYVTGSFHEALNGVYAGLTEVIDKGKEIAQAVQNGLATPAVVIGGVSRELGAVLADAKNAVEKIARQAAEIDISNAIPDAKLFGTVPLRSLIRGLLRGQFPAMNTLELPDRIERTLEWIAPLKGVDLPGVVSVKPTDLCRLRLVSRNTLLLRPGGGPPQGSVDVEALLDEWDEHLHKPHSHTARAFTLTILDLLAVDFHHVSIRTSFHTGQAPRTPDVEPEILAVRFLGPLRFIEKLQEWLQGLFGGSFELEVDPTHISVRTGFSLPPIGFGVLSLRNIVLASVLRLPFVERPLSYGFGLSSFEKPFELSVMGFAGRGFFMTAFDAAGTRELKGALEFGGALSFDIVIASGGLYVMAGIYYEISNGRTELSGYLRAGGQLDVLGLIHVSVEFMLGLRYQVAPDGAELYGFCRITVSIEFFFLSIDVSLEMEKHIAGSKLANRQQELLMDTPRASAVALPPQCYVGAKGRYKTIDKFVQDYWRYF